MNKKMFSLCAALLCSTVFAADYQDGKAAMAAAKKFQQEKKNAEAIQTYQDAAKLLKNPNEQVDAITRAARILSSEKKSEDAIKLLLPYAQNEALAAPQRTMAYLECAKAAASAEEAMKYYDLGIALKANDWTEGACYNNKAELLLKQKKSDDAEAIYKQVSGNEKYNEITRSAAYTGLIKIASAKKDYTTAHACCAKIRELGQKRYAFLVQDAEQQEAVLFMEEQKWNDAVESYKKIAANTKISKSARVRAIEAIISVEFDKRNQPEAAKKAIELFKTYDLPVSKKAQKYEKEIKELME